MSVALISTGNMCMAGPSLAALPTAIIRAYSGYFC